MALTSPKCVMEEVANPEDSCFLGRGKHWSFWQLDGGENLEWDGCMGHSSARTLAFDYLSPTSFLGQLFSSILLPKNASIDKLNVPTLQGLQRYNCYPCPDLLKK